MPRPGRITGVAVAAALALGLAACTDEPATRAGSGAATSSATGPATAAPTTQATATPAPAVTPAAALPGASSAARQRLGRPKGAEWEATPLPADVRAGRLDVAALSARDWGAAWAVGSVAPADVPAGSLARDPRARGVALGWDGRRWTRHPVPAGTTRLTSVATAGAGEAWAVGESWGPTGTATHLLHWTGTVWREEPPAVQGPEISASARVEVVTTDGRGHVWLGGQDGEVALVARREGGRWVRQRPPAGDGVPAGAAPVRTAPGTPEREPGRDLSVTALSAAPDGRLWAAARPPGTGLVLIESWDGTAWRSERTLGGNYVAIGNLTALEGGLAWYTTARGGGGGVGNPMLRFGVVPPVDAVQVGAPTGTSQPAPDDVTRLDGISGHGRVLEWAGGETALVRFAGGRWVPAASGAAKGVAVGLLAPVPGRGGTWLAGTGPEDPVLLRHR